MAPLKHKRTTVALIFGGRSAEHDISLRSAATIYSNLNKTRYLVRSIYIDKRGLWRIVGSPLRSRAELLSGRFKSFLPWESGFLREPGLRADIYFPVLHGPYGEDGTIQGVLEMAGVPYVGAAVTASAVGMDKVIQKTLFGAAGLPLVRFIVVKETEWRKDRSKILNKVRRALPLPFFVKPANLGSSVGITKVKTEAALSGAVKTAFAYDETVLIEEGIQGRELECSVLGHRSARASAPGELIPDREFYDYEDKYLCGKTRFLIPAPLPARTSAEVRRLAVAAFEAIGCSGMARVDFFLEKQTGRLYVNEINTIPGFTEISMYPRLWSLEGMGFPALLDELIRLGFERHRLRKRCVELRPE